MANPLTTGSSTALTSHSRIPDNGAICDAIRERLKETSLQAALGEMQAYFGFSTPMFIAGGFVRDSVRLALEDRNVEVNDIDIVIDTKDLARCMAEMPGKKAQTSLGGFRWWPSGSDVWIDLWQLQDTVWIQELRIKPTINNVLAGFDLNINRAAFGLHDGSLIDRGCLSGVGARLIDLDATVHLDQLLEIEVARAVSAHLITGYTLSNRIIELLRSRTILSPRVIDRLNRDGYSKQRLDRLQSVVYTYNQKAGRDDRSAA